MGERALRALNRELRRACGLEQEEAAVAENTLFGVPLRSPPFWVGEQDFVVQDSEGQSRDVIVSSEEKEGEAAAVVEGEQAAAVVSQTADGADQSSNKTDSSSIITEESVIWITDESDLEYSDCNSSSSESDIVMSFKVGGTFGPFDEAKEDIESYISRLKSTLIVSKVQEDHKVHALISVIGPQAYCTLRNLCSPVDPSTKTFDECTQLLIDHYANVNIMSVQHLKLDTRIQQPGESVAKYAEALRFLAHTCKFTSVDVMNSYLTNVFPRNLRDDRIKMILIPENLKFEDAVKRAKALECTFEQISVINATQTKSTEVAGASAASISNNDDSVVHAVHSRLGRGSDQRRDTTRQDDRGFRHWLPRRDLSERCVRCGGSHDPDTCYMRDQRCYSCGGVGHLARMCHRARHASKKKEDKKTSKSHKYKKHGRVHYTACNDNVESSTSSDSSDPLGVNMISSIHKANDGFTIVCRVNNVDLTMCVDTCADVSVIPYDEFIRVFPDTKLTPCTDTLTSYGGTNLQVLGQFFVTVAYNKQLVHDLPLVVVKTNMRQPNLFGLNWLRIIKIDWSKFYSVNYTKSKKSKVNHNYKAKSDYKIENFELHQKTLTDLNGKFPQVFDNDLSSIKGYDCHIHVKDNSVPKFSRAYDVPYAILKEVDKELDELLEQGILKPVSYSEWASPLVTVPKEQGGVRLCADFKTTLNPCLLSDQYPLPVFSNMSTQWANCNFFSKIDLKKAYLQLNVHPDSQKYLTVNTHRGLFQFTRLVYGISSAPAIFQQIMEQVLHGLKGVTCYLDDVLVSGKDLDQAGRRLQRVFSRLAKYNIKVNQKKCVFLQSSVEYVGHLVDFKGIHPLPSKVFALRHAPTPQSAEELGTFLGVLNYYHDYVPMLSAIAQPLYEAANSSNWSWNEKLESCYQTVKNLLTSDLVLIPYDPEKSIIVTADAAPNGIGGVLSLLDSGVEKPVAFVSRTLSKAEKKYSQLEKEALALIFTLKKFHKYLYGRHFVLYTDHKPLTSIFDPHKNIPSLARARIQRWALILSAYQYEIKFRKGTENVPADVLSRLPISVSFKNHKVNYIDLLPTDISLNYHEIAKETMKDPILIKVKTLTFSGWPEENSDCNLTPFWTRRHELSIEKDCLLWGNRVVIPKKIQSSIISLLHVMHPGITRMKALARSLVWFPNIDDCIESCVKQCDTCLLTQNSKPQNTAFWPQSERFFQRVHIDFAKFDNQNIFILFDSYSKWLEAQILSNTDADSTIDVLNSIISVFGFPEEMVSDNGPPYQSEKFNKFCMENNIKHTLTPPYHSQSNGGAERAVQTVKKSLKKQLLDCKKNNANFNIKSALLKFLFSYRSTPCSITNKSPAELVLKKLPKSKLTDINPLLTNNVVLPIDSKKPNIEFLNGAHVLVKCSDDQLQKWQRGIVECKMSAFVYKVLVSNVSRLYHIDHMKNYTGVVPCEGKEKKPKETVQSFGPRKSSRVPKPNQKYVS
jgi:hypothetical protein